MTTSIQKHAHEELSSFEMQSFDALEVTKHTRAWIELSSQAFFYNTSQIKQIVGTSYIAAVLKANAYGHGLTQMGLLCDKTPLITMICVAFLSEALLLRKMGVVKPILILSYIDGDIQQAVGKNIAFVIDSYEQAHLLDEYACKHKTIIDVHIKVDTGLTRRGVQAPEVVVFLRQIFKFLHIRIAGICSHFVSAYIDEETTRKQITLFEQIIQQNVQHGMPLSFVHMSNSSCTAVVGCNLLRTGIALYGYNPKDLGILLKPVLQFKTRIVQINTVAADVLVGYDGTYRTTRQTLLAYVPIGYFDGYDTRFSNKGVVYIRGSYAPVRGRVAMNMTALDITDIPGVMVGDEVLVLGDREGIRGFDLCTQAEMTNVRELLTRLNPLLPRVIV